MNGKFSPPVTIQNIISPNANIRFYIITVTIFLINIVFNLTLINRHLSITAYVLRFFLLHSWMEHESEKI
jgi:hypothetical protein